MPSKRFKKSSSSKSFRPRRRRPLSAETAALMAKVDARLKMELEELNGENWYWYNPELFVPKLRKLQSKAWYVVTSNKRTGQVADILNKTMAKIERLHEDAKGWRDNLVDRESAG